MNLALFGGFEKNVFAPGWTKETVVALFGGGTLDLRGASPAEGARLTGVAVFGGIDIVVAPGTRVSMSGASVFGGRTVKVEAGDGPAVAMKLVAVLGGIEVKDRD